MGKAGRKKKTHAETKDEVPGESGPQRLLTGKYGFALVFFILAVTALLIYSNTFSSPFQFDDKSNIVDNYKLRDLSNFWPPSGTRYVGLLSFALNYHFGGLDVFGYHIINIIIHIINGFLVWSLVVLSFKTPAMERASVNPQLKYFIALAASLIFITHPVQTQAVTYIVQRFASLAALFYLLALVLYIQARLSPIIVGQGFSLAKARGSGVKTILLGLGSLLSAVLAMKTKEISFTLPFIILLCEFMFFEGKILTRKNLVYLAPLLLTVLIIPLSLIGIDKPIGDVIGELREAAQETEAIPRWVYLLTQFSVIITYIRLFFLPINQNLDYDYPLSHSLLEPGVFLSFLFLLSVFAFAVYFFMRSRKTDNVYGLLASFGILWFFITLSVESSIIPIRDVINEHRLYLPCIGVLIAFCAGVFYLFEQRKVKNLVLATSLLFLVTAVPLGATTFNRNLIWKEEVMLWEDVVQKSSGKARGHYNLGLAYNNQSQIDEAIAEYKIAIGLLPGYYPAHNNLGNIYLEQDLTDEAIEEYKEALRLKPDYANAHSNLGNAYNKIGRIDDAIQESQLALKFKPDFADAHNNLGTAYRSIGQIQKAIEEYREALRLKPDFADAHNNLGTAYRSIGQIQKAIEEYKEALRLKPDSEKAHNNLGNVYVKLDRIDEAIKEYKTALKLKPNFADAHNNLGNAYVKLGRIDEAIGEYKEALKARSDFAEVHFNLGLAYIKMGLRNEAIREFEAGLKIRPDDERARQALQSLTR